MKYDDDIIVAGAGAAGIAAAISASRRGSKVILIEKTSHLGGTVTQSLIHTIGGLYDSSGDFINDGLSVELAERLMKINSHNHKRKIGKTWVLSTSPEDYEQLMEEWIAEETNIKVYRKSSITSVSVEEGSVTLIGLQTDQHLLSLQPGALIDTTGSAEVIRMIDPHLVRDDHKRTSAGLIFRMRGVKPDVLRFPGNVAITQKIRQAVKNGALTTECGSAWVDRGVMEDEAYIKLQVQLSEYRKTEPRKKAESNTEKIRDELVLFMTKIPEFSNACITGSGKLGIRDGGRIRGEYELTANDVRELRKFENPACRCCWPIEFWDQELGVEVEYLPDKEYYEIPLQALRVRGMKNVWAAGKCLSADRKAQASARVAGSCWAMGDAVGNHCQ